MIGKVKGPVGVLPHGGEQAGGGCDDLPDVAGIPRTLGCNNLARSQIAKEHLVAVPTAGVAPRVLLVGERQLAPRNDPDDRGLRFHQGIGLGNGNPLIRDGGRLARRGRFLGVTTPTPVDDLEPSFGGHPVPAVRPHLIGHVGGKGQPDIDPLPLVDGQQPAVVSDDELLGVRLQLDVVSNSREDVRHLDCGPRQQIGGDVHRDRSRAHLSRLGIRGGLIVDHHKMGSVARNLGVPGRGGRPCEALDWLPRLTIGGVVGERHRRAATTIGVEPLEHLGVLRDDCGGLLEQPCFLECGRRFLERGRSRRSYRIDDLLAEIGTDGVCAVKHQLTGFGFDVPLTEHQEAVAPFGDLLRSAGIARIEGDARRFG